MKCEEAFEEYKVDFTLNNQHTKTYHLKGQAQTLKAGDHLLKCLPFPKNTQILKTQWLISSRPQLYNKVLLVATKSLSDFKLHLFTLQETAAAAPPHPKKERLSSSSDDQTLNVALMYTIHLNCAEFTDFDTLKRVV